MMANTAGTRASSHIHGNVSCLTYKGERQSEGGARGKVAVWELVQRSENSWWIDFSLVTRLQCKHEKGQLLSMLGTHQADKSELTAYLLKSAGMISTAVMLYAPKSLVRTTACDRSSLVTLWETCQASEEKEKSDTST